MSTRQLMLAVTGLAALMASPRLPGIRAWQEHRRWKGFYDEGRITGLKHLEKSEDLLKAQMALSLSETERKSFISAHLNRASEILKLERDKLSCRGGVLDVIEIEQYLHTFNFRMNEKQGCPCLTAPCPLFHLYGDPRTVASSRVGTAHL
jgi:hypothetical protein